MHKSILITVFALTAACSTEPNSPDPAAGMYRLESVTQNRTAPPFTVHIESSRTAVRNRSEVLSDMLELRADGTWEERTVWRYTDYEIPSASVPAFPGESAGTFHRERGQLVLTSTISAGASGFLASVGLPATSVVTADTLFIPGGPPGFIAWLPRFTRIP